VVYSENGVSVLPWSKTLATMIGNGLVFAPNNLVFAGHFAEGDSAVTGAGTEYLSDFSVDAVSLSSAGIDLGLVSIGQAYESDDASRVDSWANLLGDSGIMGLEVGTTEYDHDQFFGVSQQPNFDLFLFGDDYLTSSKGEEDIEGGFDNLFSGDNKPYLGFELSALGSGFDETALSEQISSYLDVAGGEVDLFTYAGDDEAGTDAVTAALGSGWVHIDRIDFWFKQDLFSELTGTGSS
jgi:hypothetical protein